MNGNSEWKPIKTAPKDGTRIILLAECESVWDEPEPTILRGGWRRVGERDKVVGWRPRTTARRSR